MMMEILRMPVGDSVSCVYERFSHPEISPTGEILFDYIFAIVVLYHTIGSKL